MQTLRNILSPPRPELARWPEQTLWFRASNGVDWLSGRLQSPAGTSRPLVAIAHGLTGSCEGATLVASAAVLLAAGYPVLRLNLRGAGETAPRCASFYHTGLTADIAALIPQLPDPAANGVILMGYSLGGNTVLKYLTEGMVADAVMGGAAVSAPIMPAHAVAAIEQPRNTLYARYLLKWMKEGAAASQFPAPLKQAAAAARSIRHYDETVTAPMHGFQGAEDFYSQAASAPHLRQLARPALVITAQDDSWIPVADYRKVDWAAIPTQPAGSAMAAATADFTQRTRPCPGTTGRCWPGWLICWAFRRCAPARRCDRPADGRA
ncbi:YheT family hydrolase [Hankyongella ginsenosidimutans]|uniref:YheT family hydrolase n=1 Tax=Hankyongella ginsenosidimutans TaxID=1763828 RepID=UPI001CA37C94|nr:alpha/beta fold hydrolase [Hankyongella ginsenosidimutans]